MSELALKLIREAKEKRLTRLDLGNCGLRVLPNELVELYWLEELYLSNDEGNILMPEWEYRSNDKPKINNPNCLNTLNGVISHLVNLKKIVLQGQKKALSGLLSGHFQYDNNITDLTPIASLENLEELIINTTEIKDLSPIKGLRRLKKLDISDSRVEKIEPLSYLINLEQLNISQTRVEDIRFLNELNNLKNINISFLKLNDLSCLINFPSLESLRMNMLKLKQDIDFSPINSLLKLQSLKINGVYINNTFNINNLTYLKKLDFGSVNVGNITDLQYNICLEELNLQRTVVENLESLSSLQNLQYLNLSWNRKINDISPLSKLFQMKELVIWGTNVEDLTPVSNLINLQKIDFANSKVKDINPLKNLLNLNLVNLSNTDVKSIYALKNIIKQGVEVLLSDSSKNNLGICIEHRKITDPPIDIIKQGSSAILNYWNQIEKQGGTEAVYEGKLIIVGEGKSGKTTLFKKLINPKYQLEKLNETHGINIHEGLPFKHMHIGANTFHANLWDFGGQELQYMTHQFFLTPRALYILMMDARRESPNLAYWFKIISLLGRDNADSTEKVRLLLVFNKRGNSTGTSPQYQDQLKYYADSLDVKYLEVDFAENDYRFDNLQNEIQQSLVTLPIVKSQLPRLWKAVREDLREEAKTENYIDTKRFSAICSKHGITEEADQWLLSGYLHQLGSLLHFQNDKGLRRLVILSPQWAVDGVYTFLSEESIARNNGRFTETEFMALLARRDYNRDAADVILQLMTKNNFDICYEATEHNYVAAQLLPDNAPPYKWFPKEVLQFRYQYPIMPKGLMSRLIVRLSDDIERDKISGEQIVWKKGVVLHIKSKEGECRVRLREDDAESKAGLRQILIDVMGDRDARKYALRKVRDTVDDLHKRWFRSIKADEMVPCCCSECTVSDNPQLYKLENLLKRRLKRPDHSCDISGEDLMIQQLLEGVYDKNEINNMENQRGF